MNISVEKIDVILREEDIEGLIEQEAPIDEYSFEAREIANKLSSYKGYLDINTITRIISEIWQSNFELSESEMQLRMPSLERAAERIFNY